MVLTTLESAFPCEMFVSELQFVVKHPEEGVKAQLQFGHLNLITVCFLQNTHHTVFTCLFECLSTVCLSLSLFSHCHFEVSHFSLKAFPKNPELKIKLTGTCVAKLCPPTTH
jgi:hypothetical protein